MVSLGLPLLRAYPFSRWRTHTTVRLALWGALGPQGKPSEKVEESFRITRADRADRLAVTVGDQAIQGEDSTRSTGKRMRDRSATRFLIERGRLQIPCA